MVVVGGDASVVRLFVCWRVRVMTFDHGFVVARIVLLIVVTAADFGFVVKMMTIGSNCIVVRSVVGVVFGEVMHGFFVMVSILSYNVMYRLFPGALGRFMTRSPGAFRVVRFRVMRCLSIDVVVTVTVGIMVWVV